MRPRVVANATVMVLEAAVAAWAVAAVVVEAIPAVARVTEDDPLQRKTS